MILKSLNTRRDLAQFVRQLLNVRLKYLKRVRAIRPRYRLNEGSAAASGLQHLLMLQGPNRRVCGHLRDAILLCERAQRGNAGSHRKLSGDYALSEGSSYLHMKRPCVCRLV